MNVFKKGLTTLAIGGFSIAAWLAGNALVQDVKFAHAQDQVQASREQLKSIEDFAGAFKTVGKAVEPSVVSIEVHKTIKTGAHGNMPNDLLKKFFKDRDGDGNPDVPDDMQNLPDSMDQAATGSGVIMEYGNGEGYILTNNHVAGGAEKMTITLSDGRTITKAKVLGTDPKTDLAVVKIEADRLIPAKWGDSDALEKGDIVMAFGSPFGFVGSMTHGIVSGLNRQAGIVRSGFAYENFIQVDAPINPGNSGGPLVNLHGEVVGVNTAIATESGGFQGIGFAIPSNQAKEVYRQLKEKGKVVRGYIGARIQDASADPELTKSFGYQGEKGVLIAEVYPDTPSTGKLKAGDVVTSIGGKKVETGTELRNQVAATPPGSDLKFTVWRDGKSQDVTLKIGEQPEDLNAFARSKGNSEKNGSNDASGATSAETTLGLKLSDPRPELLTRSNLPDDKDGAYVLSIKPDSPLKGKVFPGELITSVGNQEVTTAADAKAALAKQDLTKGVRLYVTNAQGSRFVFVKTEK